MERTNRLLDFGRQADKPRAHVSEMYRTDDRGRQRRTDERARERSRQPGDEEDLRVRVVGDRDRQVERALQADLRRPDERRRDERRQKQPAIEKHGAGKTAADRLHGVDPRGTMAKPVAP